MFNFGAVVISLQIMENFIKNLEIKNFKSIKHLTLDNCKRVNVFIGKPNVGKSNILEALGLLGWWDFSFQDFVKKIFFDKTIRYKNASELFYDSSLKESIHLETNKTSAIIQGQLSNFHYLVANKSIISSEEKSGYWCDFSSTGSITQHGHEGEMPIEDFLVLKYDFQGVESYQKEHRYGFLAPQGDNLFEIVDSNKDLRKYVASIFDENNLQFVLSTADRTFELQKSIDGYVYKYPYSSIADTFQRYIFYLAAIESNSNSVLIFEEPEVHSFPPYVKELAERIAYKKDNQFFISTHSPYLLNTLISRLNSKELNVFLTYYKDYQTFVKPLSEESIQEVRDLGVDVFFNLDRF